jgi:hypothetical protein
MMVMAMAVIFDGSTAMILILFRLGTSLSSANEHVCFRIFFFLLLFPEYPLLYLFWTKFSKKYGCILSICHNVTTRVCSSTPNPVLSASSSSPCPQYHTTFLHYRFVTNYHKPLSSDALSGFQISDPNSKEMNKDIFDATNHLLKTVFSTILNLHSLFSLCLPSIS